MCERWIQKVREREGEGELVYREEKSERVSERENSSGRKSERSRKHEREIYRTIEK